MLGNNYQFSSLLINDKGKVVLIGNPTLSEVMKNKFINKIKKETIKLKLKAEI